MGAGLIPNRGPAPGTRPGEPDGAAMTRDFEDRAFERLLSVQVCTPPPGLWVWVYMPGGRVGAGPARIQTKATIRRRHIDLGQGGRLRGRRVRWQGGA